MKGPDSRTGAIWSGTKSAGPELVLGISPPPFSSCLGISPPGALGLGLALFYPTLGWAEVFVIC